MKRIPYELAVKRVRVNFLSLSPFTPFRVIQQCIYPAELAIENRDIWFFSHILMVLSGNMVFYQGEKKHEAKPGCIIFLPKNSTIRWEVRKETDMLQIQFKDPIDIDRYGELATIFGPLQETIFSIDGGRDFLDQVKQRLTLAELSDIKNVMHSITAMYIMEAALKKFHEQSESRHEQQNSNSLSRCVNYIERNIDKEITLEKISRNSYLGISRVSQLFRKGLGMSPMQYVAKRKAEVAERMLAEGNASVNEVASTLGFNSVSYFSRFFKRQTGKLPSTIKVQDS